MTRSIVLMILVCTVLYSIETANIDKFLERDLLPRSHDTYRRNIIPPIHIMKTNKQTRTIITDNTDIPTSNTPDTPASDVDTPDTPDLSGDGISEYSGNDIDDASGRTNELNDTFILHKKPTHTVLTLLKNANNLTYNVKTNDSNTSLTQTHNIHSYTDDSLNTHDHTTITKAYSYKPKAKDISYKLNNNLAILKTFYDQKKIKPFQRGYIEGYSKKSKIVHKSKNVSLKSTIKADKSPKDVSKKQYLGVPAQREGLGGEPVGDLNAEGGLGGLGGDMGGIPTGMGAGAEPLGAFENNNEAPQQAPENEVANNQGLEEEGSPPIAAFNKGERGPESEGENSEFIHDEVGNGPGARPFDREDMGEGSPIRGGGGMNFNAPQPDMTESMTNNIGAMDKANIQGDSEVAEMVRQYAKGKDTLNNSPFEQPEVPQPNEAQLSREGQLQKNAFEEDRPLPFKPNKNVEDSKEESFWEQNGDVKFENPQGSKFPEGNFETMNNLEKALDNEMLLDKGIEARAKAAMRREDDISIFNNNFVAKPARKIDQVDSTELSKIRSEGDALSRLFENGEMFGKTNRYSEKFLDTGNSIDAKAIEEGNTVGFKSLSLPRKHKENVLKNDMFRETPRIQGGIFSDMEAAAMTQGSNLNTMHRLNQGDDNMVMEPATVYGMNDGLVRQPLPGSQRASFLPANYEMTAVDPRILDMQQLALEKRKKVIFSNDTKFHFHTRNSTLSLRKYLKKDNHTLVLPSTKFKPIIKLKPKVESQNIQRTSLKKDIGFIKLKDLPPAGQGPIRHKHLIRPIKKLKPKSKQTVVIHLQG